VPKILIIDDSETDRYTYRRYLEQASPEYEVHEAADCPTGLALVQSVDPDCVLLDLRLREPSGREQSGYNVLRELVGEEGESKRPVIMLSVLAWNGLRHGARLLGASHYLVKGQCTAAALDQAIREAIARHMAKGVAGRCSGVTG
jgi:CheY-like chemotaxis protein